MEQPELRVFFEKAGSQLAGIRGGLLLAAQNGFSARDVEIAASRLDIISIDAGSCGLNSVSDTATCLAFELRGIASSGHVSHSDAIRSLDIVARVEAALLEISLRSEDFLTGVDELVESSFGRLQGPAAAADESIADDEEQFEIDEETLEIFRSEADGLLANITANLDLLGASPGDTNALWEIRRNAHTFKGAAGIVGFKAASSLAHCVEDLLDQMVESHRPADNRVIELLANANKRLSQLSYGIDFGDTDVSLDFEVVLASLTANGTAKGNSNDESKAHTLDPASKNDRSETKRQTPIVRVSLDRLDNLLATARNLIANGSELARRREVQSIDSLAPLIESQGRLADEILQKLLDIRMVRFGTLETRLSRGMHVTCQEESKKAMLSLNGGDVEIDTLTIDALIEPLLHLLKNAVVHGIEPAETRRLLGKPEKGRIEIEAGSRAGELIVTISDDGKGISTGQLIEKAVANGLVTADAARTISEQEAMELIFYRGLTTAETLNLNAGRGVGMSIIRQSVESQGGSLTVASEPQKGACFTITIPFVQTPAAAELPPVEPVQSTSVPLVLVVDDSASIRRQMAKFVEDVGLRAITAVDGADALELLLNGTHEPDLILSDVEMPNMDGWEFLKYVKTDNNFGHLPVVMVTSLDADNYRQMASRLGASDYIVKPFSAKDLENVLAKFCSVAA